jgi:hypothetical protein
MAQYVVNRRSTPLENYQSVYMLTQLTVQLICKGLKKKKWDCAFPGAVKVIYKTAENVVVPFSSFSNTYQWHEGC